MPHIKKLILTLLSVHSQYTWYGWKKDGSFGKGCFIAFEANVLGFTITIHEHDYRDNRYLPRDVFHRRCMEEANITWIEMEVSDITARFGRRQILGRTIFLVDNPLYKNIKRLFDEIKARSKVFDKGKEKILPGDIAVKRMATLLQKASA